MNWKSPKDKIKAIKDSDDEALEWEAIDAEVIEEDDIPDDKQYAEVEDKDLEWHLNPRHLRFCKIYTSNEEVLWNWVRSYAKAYGIEDKIDTHYKSIQVCSSRLLWNVIICRYIRFLIDLQYSPEIIDKQLMLFSLQKEDKRIAISAIQELNKLKWRIVEKTDNTHSFNWPLVQIVKQSEVEEKKE